LHLVIGWAATDTFFIVAMRLRLTIQRHALPPTNILWTVRVQDPTSTSAPAYATISQLLEDVNDVVPLESNDWGLEDYVVEIGGYECLHFQPVDSVLKEDDKITIRALQTSDLRVRKLGGRHQISPDGRHLFDGVAFGRHYLRKTARPAFRIPSRKRRKLDLGQGQYIEDDSIVQALLPENSSAADTALVVDEDGADLTLRDDNTWQIVARQHFEDADQDPVGEQDDSDFVSSAEYEEDEEDLELSEELRALLDDQPSERGDEKVGENNQSFNAELETNSIHGVRQRGKRKRDREGAADEGSIGSTGNSNSPSTLVHTALPDTRFADSSSTSVFGSEAGEEMHVGETWRRIVEDFERSRGTSHSSGTNFSGLASSKSEDQSGSASPCSSTSSSTSSSTGSESETSSECASESESESESESSLESESGSKSESESELESGNGKEMTAAPLSIMRMKGGQTTKMESCLSDSPVTMGSAPGEGLNRTYRNNQRVKKRKRLNSLKAAGLLASDASFKELSTFEQSESDGPMKNHLAQRDELHDVFEARKQELLGQVVPEAGLIPLSDSPQDTTERAPYALTYEAAGMPAQPVTANNEEDRKRTPNKRSKLDIESSRRMLFGALGLKTPKTPAAEQELREKLAKRGHISANGRAKRAVVEEADDWETWKTPVSVPTQAEEAWVDRLILSAVECEVEGQVLSKPPFPFVQRWQHDKQNSQLLGHLEEYNRVNGEGQQDTSAVTDELGNGGPYVEEDTLLYGVRHSAVIQNQLIQEAQELENGKDTRLSTAPDLPSATDFNVFEALKPEDAVAGTVIAFKQLDMSKETNWQPQISAYRLAEVQEALEDGTLKVSLAERDRISTPLSFNHQTGERNFEKFEMPVDAEELGPDTGMREILYGDLIEPKLVVRKSMGPSVAESTEAAHTSTGGSKPDKGTSQLKDFAKSSEDSVGQPSAQVEVSTPQQMEISNLIKDACFHSSLDTELLQPAREGSTTTRENNPRLSSDMSEKCSSRQLINLDGAADETGKARQNSPRLAGSDSSSVYQANDFYDSSSNLEPGGQFPSTCGSQRLSDSGSKKSVIYPRLSQLVLDESSMAITNGKPQSSFVHTHSPSEIDKLELVPALFGKDNDGLPEPEESHLDSLKSTIPPSEDAAPKSGPPSATSSRITNPCLPGLDGNASSDDDLPSLSEITSTARSGRISPPQLKKASISKRKTPTSRELSLSPSEPESTENHTETQTSPTFQPSQIPPGSQVVDLTFSSDPISLDHSDGEYRSTQRSSQRIKQSSSQVKLSETAQLGAKMGNRRLVRGKLGKTKHSF
jgi:hypothetical protein